jgi:oligopeptide transport system permease protein
MAAYVFRRILWLGPTLLFISLITFALMHAIDGGPFDPDKIGVPPERIEALNRKYGLDEPVWRQYVDFLANAVQGDLGISFQRQDKDVTAIIVSKFRVTAVLGGLTIGLASVAGVGLGVLAALHRNRLPDYAGVFFASVGAAVPAFVLGILLIYVFAVGLHWLPTGGWDLQGGMVPGWLPSWRQAILPVITLAALPTAYLARVTRASVLDVLGQDYLRTARAKGLSERAVFYRHAFRNAVIPILTVVGPLSAALLTGSFIVEELFSLPGTGRLFVQSVGDRDYGLIMGATIFYGLVIAVANLVVDVAYAAVDPRIRYS